MLVARTSSFSKEDTSRLTNASQQPVLTDIACKTKRNVTATVALWPGAELRRTTATVSITGVCGHSLAMPRIYSSVRYRQQHSVAVLGHNGINS